jgi:glycosyltransferase involved in cell wall biosynthesis
VRLAVIVPFLNEEHYLGELLQSIGEQTRAPDRLLLVDDGSGDGGPRLAAAFAERHPYAQLVRRPPRPPERDRMVRAHEWRAFEWGVTQLGEDYDVVGKLDADLRLSRDFLAEIERRFEVDSSLGMAGAFLSSAMADGVFVRHRCPPEHVEGATSFYRRRCLTEISPIPAILGWDTIDEARARMRGWRTASFAIPSGDPVHLRRTGSHDGVLRGYRRAGLAAFVYGAHPLHVLLAGVNRMRDPPLLLCGLNYMAGWMLAALSRAPRAEFELRRFVRREHRRRVRRLSPMRSRA